MADFNLSRDLRRYCLALAMLRHGARPSTVRHWTGFSRQRMRRLVLNYNENRSPSEPRCNSGPPPVGLKRLLRDTHLRVELTAAAGLCRMLKVLTDHAEPVVAEHPPAPETGESLCHVFDVYLRLIPNAQLTFEQLIVLVTELSRRDRLALERCTVCETYLLIDPLSLQPRLCAQCQTRPSREMAAPQALEFQVTQQTHDAGVQQSLF